MLPRRGPPGAMQPGEFVGAALPNIVTFGLDRVAPPSPTYIQRDDVLAFWITSSVVETITFNWRQLLAPFPRGGQPFTGPQQDANQTAQSSNIIDPGQRVVNISAAHLNIPQLVTSHLTTGPHPPSPPFVL